MLPPNGKAAQWLQLLSNILVPIVFVISCSTFVWIVSMEHRITALETGKVDIGNVPPESVKERLQHIEDDLRELRVMVVNYILKEREGG